MKVSELIKTLQDLNLPDHEVVLCYGPYMDPQYSSAEEVIVENIGTGWVVIK